MAQRFKACIKDPQGTTVDVHFEVSAAGFKLLGAKGLLGSFAFQRVKSWDVEPGCFKFRVATDAGVRAIALWASADQVQAMSAAVEAAAEHRQQQPPAPAHPSPAPRSPAPPTPLTPPVSASATPPALHAAAPTASAPSSTAPPPPPPPPLPPTRRNSRHPDRHLESSQPSSSATTSATASPASTSTSTGTGASLSLEELARAPLSPLVPCLAHSSPPPLQHAASAQGSTRREPTANRGPLSPMQPSRQSVQWESPVMYPVEASLSEEEDTSLEEEEEDTSHRFRHPDDSLPPAEASSSSAVLTHTPAFEGADPTDGRWSGEAERRPSAHLSLPLRLRQSDERLQGARRAGGPPPGGGDGATAAEVRALRCELQVLRAELRTSASQREEVEAEADDMRIVLEREARLQEDNRLLLVEREQWETALREATIDAERAKQALADRKARAEEVVESQGAARAPLEEEVEHMRVALEARDAQLRHSLQRVADADQLAASLRAAVAVRDSELWAKELQLQAYENSLDHSLGLTVSMSSYPQPPASSPSSGVDQHSMHEAQSGEPLAKLRSLVELVASVKQDLARCIRRGWLDDGAAELARSVEEWIRASHALDRACRDHEPESMVS